MAAVTRYARSGDVHIAYQVFGEGPVDLVLGPGFISHVEACWDEPSFARWLNQLGKSARVITCLLYTSPSPRDISGSRMPSSA